MLSDVKLHCIILLKLKRPEMHCGLNFVSGRRGGVAWQQGLTLRWTSQGFDSCSDATHSATVVTTVSATVTATIAQCTGIHLVINKFSPATAN